MGMELPSPTSPAIARQARARAEQQSQTPQQLAIALMARKDSIQAEIDSHFSVLKQNSSSMRTPLLTPDGFPRADIDVFAVRTARVRVIELRNDLDIVMAEIAKALENCWEKPGPSYTAATPAPTLPAEVVVQRDGDPFARVDGVMPSSPASEAGLRRDDLILAFGSMSTLTNPITSLAPLAQITQAHENRDVIVIVRRAEERKRLVLRPRSGWGGRGMLGCHIVPHRP